MMVCRLTTGKKRFALVEEAMRARVEALLPLRDRLRELIDLDASAFDQVMAAYGLAQDTEEERAARMGAVSAAYEAATEVPLEVARLCMEALELAEAIAREGSENALSDAAVGGLSLHAGFRGAMCNVRINLPEVPEGPLREAAEAAVALWPARADLLAEAVRVAVDQRMVG